MSADRSVLITGGAGFIGRYVARALTQECWRVTVFDDLSSPNAQRPPTDISFVQASVLDQGAVTSAAEGCAVIIHLAEVVGVQRVLRDPLAVLQQSVEGIKGVCMAAQRHGCTTIYSSSSEVYGPDAAPPLLEGSPASYRHLPAGRGTYALAKLYGEEFLLTSAERGLSGVAIARIFNTTGPSQSLESGMVLPRMVSAALSNAPIEVFGDGHQTRTFLHVSDCAEALVRLAQNSTDAAIDRQVFNVGGTEEISMLDLAHIVQRRANSSSPIRLLAYQEAYRSEYIDTRRRAPSIEKISAALNWRPSKSIDEIVDDVISASK